MNFSLAFLAVIFSLAFIFSRATFQSVKKGSANALPKRKRITNQTNFFRVRHLQVQVQVLLTC